MAIANPTKEPDDTVETILERALIELQYMLADALFGGEGQSVDKQLHGVASYFQAAYNAVQLSIEIIEEAKAKQNKYLVA